MPRAGPARSAALAAHLTGLENRRMKREQLLAMMEGAWQASADALLAVCGRSGSCGEGAGSPAERL